MGTKVYIVYGQQIGGDVSTVARVELPYMEGDNSKLSLSDPCTEVHYKCKKKVDTIDSYCTLYALNCSVLLKLLQFAMSLCIWI